MKRFLLFVLFAAVLNHGFSQYNGSEIGIDATFHASQGGTNSGTFGFGLKYGLKYGDYVIAGPSVRYQRAWTNNTMTGQSSSFNIYGGGAFLHARFYNALFIGAEFEMLKSPYSTTGFLTTGSSTWCPILFVGGGFSREFNGKVRLNLGIMYDVINSLKSPFRSSYFIKSYDQNGNVVRIFPVIYRLALFIPLPYKGAVETTEEDEEY